MRKQIGNTNYEISTDGEVFLHGEQVSPEVTDKGYKCVRIDGKRCRIHRLVAEAFIPNEADCKFVGHKDGDPGNNRVDNLGWVSVCPKRRW